MRISSRLDYALSCILRIADGYGKGRPISLKEIAKKEGIETDYIEQLFIKMKNAGILKSVRGPAGGYLLAMPPAHITAKDIVEAIEDKVLKLVCFREKGRKKRCLHLASCRLKEFWAGLERVMEVFLDSRNLEELLKLRKREKGWRCVEDGETGRCKG